MEHRKFISLATIWEISIKHSLGKLIIRGSFEGICDDVVQNGFEFLPITFHHLSCLNKLPFHHRDPFDRLLVAQAFIENLNIISADKFLDAYFEGTALRRLW